MSIPTLNVYQGGEVVKTIVGAKPKAAIVRDLEDFITEVGEAVDRAHAMFHVKRGWARPRGLAHSHDVSGRLGTRHSSTADEAPAPSAPLPAAGPAPTPRLPSRRASSAAPASAGDTADAGAPS